ncbi:MAG: hypothetical protein IJT34_00035, partial [Butyrivibrio sp.]|nr:hypothetical protein [Butyrivibrio sp.]
MKNGTRWGRRIGQGLLTLVAALVVSMVPGQGVLAHYKPDGYNTWVPSATSNSHTYTKVTYTIDNPYVEATEYDVTIANSGALTLTVVPNKTGSPSVNCWEVMITDASNENTVFASSKVLGNSTGTVLGPVGLRKGSYHIIVRAMNVTGVSWVKDQDGFQLKGEFNINSGTSTGDNYEEEDNGEYRKATEILDGISKETIQGSSFDPSGKKHDWDYYAFELEEDADVTLNVKRDKIASTYTGNIWRLALLDEDLSEIQGKNGKVLKFGKSSSVYENKYNLNKGTYYVRLEVIENAGAAEVEAYYSLTVEAETEELEKMTQSPDGDIVMGKKDTRVLSVSYPV